MPLDVLDPEFRELTPLPRTRYLAGPTERVMQAQLPARPDPVSYIGSTAALAAASELAEPDYGDMAAERRVRDAARQRRKRASARDGAPIPLSIPRADPAFLPPAPVPRDPCGCFDAIEIDQNVGPRRSRIISRFWKN
jgi:hypothetical protein